MPKLRRQFCAAIKDDDPLLYNETASVGLLAAAAVRAGMLALAEYVTAKRRIGTAQWEPGCRSDLWVYDLSSQWSWSFEFKQIFCRPDVRIKTIQAKLDDACRDVRRVDAFEADRRFGGLFVSTRGNALLTSAAMGRIVDFAKKEATLACRIGGAEVPVYLLLKCVDRR